MGKIIFYIVFSRVQEERHFRAIFGALGYSRTGAGCVRADTLSLGWDYPKAPKNGFGGFVVNARMELERKVKKGLTKTGQVW